jgi:hypothetical protein
MTPKNNEVLIMTKRTTRSLPGSMIVVGLLVLAPAAWAQNPADCGPHVGTTAAPPCGATGVPNRDVGSSSPTDPKNQPDATSSSSRLHQEMKEIETALPTPKQQPR